MNDDEREGYRRECDYWDDGNHCYETHLRTSSYGCGTDSSHDNSLKRCACGAEVKGRAHWDNVKRQQELKEQAR